MAQVVPVNDDDGALRGADDGGRALPSSASSPGRSRRRANRGSVATIGFETPREHTVVIGSAWQLAEKLCDRPATQAVIYLTGKVGARGRKVNGVLALALGFPYKSCPVAARTWFI